MCPELNRYGQPRIEIIGENDLALKQLVPEDALAYFDALHSDPSIFRFGEEETLRKYPTVESVRVSIENTEENRFRFGIYDNDVFVGYVYINVDEVREGVIGYWVGGAYKGHHYAQRAVELAADYAFSELCLDRLIADVDPRNGASIKALIGNGFNYKVGFKKQIYEKRRPTIEIAGPGVNLREITAQEAPDIVRLAQKNAEQLHAAEIYVPVDINDVLSKIDNRTQFAIYTPEGVAGQIDLIEHTPSVAEVVSWVDVDLRGKGIATKSLATLAFYVFDDMRYKSLRAWVKRENIASQKVLERVGFVQKDINPTTGSYGYTLEA